MSFFIFKFNYNILQDSFKWSAHHTEWVCTYVLFSILDSVCLSELEETNLYYFNINRAEENSVDMFLAQQQLKWAPNVLWAQRATTDL